MLSIREPVESLIAKGLLGTGPKVGTRVRAAAPWNWFDPDFVGWQSRAGLSHEFLQDLQELRQLVEPAAVRLAAERATPLGVAEIEAACAGMQHAIEDGGDYLSSDLRSHRGLLHAHHNRMVGRMRKALGALLRTGFEISTARPDSLAASLPLHRAVLDAVIARSPQEAERAILVLIDGANDDIAAVVATRRQAASARSAGAPTQGSDQTRFGASGRRLGEARPGSTTCVSHRLHGRRPSDAFYVHTI